MKLLNKTILLRSVASDPTIQLPKKSSSSPIKESTITIDLANKAVLPALQTLSQNHVLRRNVTTAVVNAESCVWYGNITMDHRGLVKVFQCLAKLPCLQLVTIDLSLLNVPVAAITALLKDCKTLTELQLMNIRLVGSIKPLEEALLAHTELACVRCFCCKGRAIQSFMTKLSSLKRLELRHTHIGEVGDNDQSPWIGLAGSKKLQTLAIHEVPEFKTRDILNFVSVLNNRQAEGRCKLQELHITAVDCDVDGQRCGTAMADFLLTYPQSSVRTLTLKFGNPWKTAGLDMSRVLCLNPGITSLCVELSNRDCTRQAQKVVHSLRHNTVLKRLKFCLDRDRALDGPLETWLLQDMETLLVEHNHTLQNVVLLDENRSPYRLTPAIQHKLELNRSRLPQLLHSGCPSTESLLAMIESKDNLDAVFYALSNQPSLIYNSAPPAMTGSDSESDSSDDGSADSTAHGGKIKNHKTKKGIMSFFKINT